MKRGTIIMILGLSVQVITWIISSISSNLAGVNSESLHSIKSGLGYVSLVGWLVFFAGFGIRQLDKRKLQLNESNRKK
jgi:uncharacterized membrane protein YGL010W